MKEEPIAVLCSDIHLCHTPPTARSAEPDWYAAMGRGLGQLQELADGKPVICGGDVFDRWNPPPRLINFALLHLPRPFYTVYGQHDLPYHNTSLSDFTGLYTLVEAGKVSHLYPGSQEYVHTINGGIDIRGFDWGEELEGPEHPTPDGGFPMLVAHRYVWKPGCSYPGAPDTGKVSGLKESLAGYELALFGDNHIPFTAMSGNCQVVNPGCLIPRKQDEREHGGNVVLLYSDGSVELVRLDDKKDVWLDDDETVVYTDRDMEHLVQTMRELAADSMDFRKLVERYLDENDMDDMVRELLLKSLEA